MRPGLRSGERGFTLIEVLLAAVLSLIIIGSAMTAFVALTRRTDQTTRLNDAQDNARLAISTLAKQLRNLASPTPSQPLAVDVAGGTDLVFQTVDPVGPNSGANKVNVRRLRYCLGTAAADKSKLYLQAQRWTTSTTPAVPSTAACPGTGWTSTRQVAGDVTNLYNGQTRAVFGYNAAGLTSITRISAELWVDPQPTQRPNEVSITTAVNLRNQNRAPVAAFTVTNTTGNSVLLNGSTSEDPENQTLTFSWWDTYNGTKTRICTTTSTVVCAYTPTGAGTHALSLTVTDPSGLTSTADPQNKTI